jgi:pyruvate dehydrogenase E2 component (dihydrolipoamide acetyltransferase)
VNYPEVCIMGISRSRTEARYVGGEPVPRLMLPVCISYDHRVIDGAQGARFIKYFAESMGDPERLLLGL